jgi:hypothetical protein
MNTFKPWVLLSLLLAFTVQVRAEGEDANLEKRIEKKSVQNASGDAAGAKRKAFAAEKKKALKKPSKKKRPLPPRRR